MAWFLMANRVENGQQKGFSKFKTAPHGKGCLLQTENRKMATVLILLKFKPIRLMWVRMNVLAMLCNQRQCRNRN